MSTVSQSRSKPPAPGTARPALGAVNGKQAPSSTQKPTPSSFTTPANTAPKPRIASNTSTTTTKPTVVPTVTPVEVNLPPAATPKLSSAPQLLSSGLIPDKTKSRISPPSLPAPSQQLPPVVTPKASDSQIKPRVKPSFPPGLTTPVAAAPVAVRSYSEIVKSEEALNQLLIKKNQEMKELKDMVTSRDVRVLTLESEINALKDELARTAEEADAKLRDTLSLHSQQYKELNNSFLNLSSKYAQLESKLEECGYNPITMRPWDLDEEDQAKIDAEEAEMDRLGKEIEERWEERNVKFSEIQSRYLELETTLPELLEPLPALEIDDAELDQMERDLMNLKKELGLHVSTPLGDVTTSFGGNPEYQDQFEDHVEDSQVVEEQSFAQQEHEGNDSLPEVSSSRDESNQITESFAEDNYESYVPEEPVDSENADVEDKENF